MASQQGFLYDHPSRSGPSSSSMPLSHDSPLLDSALRSSREAASTTKLPSALGIGPSTSQSPSTSNAATSNASSLGWTMTGNGSVAAQNASQSRSDSQWIRSTVDTSSSSLSPDLTGATSSAPVAGGEGSTTGGQRFHPPMQSVPQGSLDRITTTGGSMQSSSGANGSTRNFLVPIGATGARQKLSILSAAQRPVTSASATASSPHQGSDTVSQRSLNQLDPWSGRRRPMTSGEGSRATSLGTDRRLQQDRTAAVTGDHNRSFSTGRYDHLSPSTLQAKPENGDALAHRRAPQRDTPSMFRAASWQTASDSGNESSSLPQRQGSTIGGANQGYPQLRSNGRAGEEGSSSVDPSSSTQPLMLIDGRNSDAGLQRQALRPSSSAGRERAAKIGAGFKNMFASRSGKEGSPKGVSEGGDSPLSNRNLQLRPHQLPNTSSQPDKKSETEATDPNSAQSVGWTASFDGESAKEQREQAEPELPLQRRKPSLLSRRTEAKAVGDRSPLSRMSDTPPSIDLELPAMGGLFGSFASDQLFPYNTTPDEGTGSRGARNAKGVPTTGLNLEVAGQSFPSSQYSTVVEREEDKEVPLQDKSLPPTPVIDDWKRSSNASGPHERPTQGWARAAEVSGPGKGPASVLPTTGPLSSPLFDRIASLALANESSRRGSATTATTSDGHEASLETPSRSNHSARSTSDNRTSSPGESTYSAPNSSRTWSPVTSDKPSVPMTSPLLASLMGQNVQSQLQQQQQQQQQQQHGNIAEHVGLEQKRIASPLTTSSFSAADSSVTSSQPAFTSTLSSPSPRPDLPAKSRDRQSMGLQADAATLAKLENGRNSQRTDYSPSNALEPILLTAGTKEDTAASQSTYVPPGALTYTRKGTAVRPTASKIDPVAIVGERDVHSSAGLEPVLPTYKSRFSETSSDTASSPHSFIRQTGTLVTSSGGGGGTADGQIISFTSNDYDSYEDEVAVDVVNLLPASAWTEVEAALGQFKTMSVPNAVSSDKGGLLRSVLLPFLALEAETVSFEVSGSSHFNSGKTRRALFFEWIQHLLLELQTVQTSADRGAILESIACIIESRNFSASMFQSDEDDENKFYSVFGHILSYAIGELNKKGVYQNTLIFSGRLLAVAFFRIDGVASKLLRALPVNRFALERVAAEIDWESNMPGDWEAYRRRFPPSLHDFCFQDARSYLKMLDSQTAAQPGDEQNDEDRFLVRQPNVEVEMSGNWLRRWQSDDSELFFSFCRSYHRQLSALLTAHRGSAPSGNSFFGGPGYAHLATCIHQKCLSLVHRDILSVTTLSSQKNFNPGETANVLSGSTAGKPRHLEAANRRCTAIVVDIIRAPSASNQQTFGPMLGIHIKCLIKRTSLYDVQGVFCLLDWLDGVLNHMESAELPIDGLVDVEFLIQTIWLLLKDADHALALMRTIAFCYSNFAILTSSSKNRIRFCEEILLHPKIFQKLFLSWSFTIRAYFLHLLVFRLARINDFPQPEKDTRGKTAISVARLFNQRLDEIRKRHDELSPTASSADSVSEEEEETKTKTKARTQSFVSTIKHTSPPSTNSESPGSLTKAERLLGIGQLDPALSIKGETKVQSRAAKWLRALSAKGTSKGSKRIEASLLGSPYLGASPISDGRPFSASEGAEEETQKALAEMTNEADAKQEKGDRAEDGLGLTGADEKAVGTPTSEGVFEFSFEARNSAPDGQGGEARFDDDDNAEEEKSANEHISRKLSFDLQSPTSALPPPSAQSSSTVSGEDARGVGGKLSVSGSQSRVSKAFNRRQSLLPGPAFNLVNDQGGSEDEDGGDAAIGAVSEKQRSQTDKKHANSQQMLVAEPYSQTLHIYAVQSLREYEQTVLEHDEFFAKQADADNPQVPRLPIQWPAMWSE